MRIAAISIVTTFALVGVARGDANELNFNRMKEKMPGVAPGPGRDKAPLRPAPWCDSVKLSGEGSPDAVVWTFEGEDGISSLTKAARLSCAYTKTPIGQTASTMIEQTWINLTGLSEADAVESITARVHEDVWEAERQKLCGSLEVSNEMLGEERAFMATRRILFGCRDGTPQWRERDPLPDDLLAFVDQSDIPADELIRISRILGRTSWTFNSTNADHVIVEYAIDSYDYRALSPANALKVLEAAPYAGNRYARIIVKESIAGARIGIATFEQEAKKRTNDADWKELLITAPQRGIEAYIAEAEQYKAEIARSNEFEHKVLGPSKRAAAGCEAQLRKDFLTVYKKLPHSTVNQAKESLSDPVANLLFSRLIVCMGIGDEDMASEVRSKLQRDVRNLRGVRAAAYYAALEAAAKIRADRERFPLAPVDISAKFYNEDVLKEVEPNKATRFEQEQTGVVKSVDKIANGLHVTFATAKHQVMSRSCVDTNRIMQIRTDGTVQYYQNCHDDGLITVNDTPEEITIPTLFADGITPGCAMDFGVTSGHKLQRVAIPRAVFSDKLRKKLVNYYGFAF